MNPRAGRNYHSFFFCFFFLCAVAMKTRGALGRWRRGASAYASPCLSPGGAEEPVSLGRIKRGQSFGGFFSAGERGRAVFLDDARQNRATSFPEAEEMLTARNRERREGGGPVCSLARARSRRAGTRPSIMRARDQTAREGPTLTTAMRTNARRGEGRPRARAQWSFIARSLAGWLA